MCFDYFLTGYLPSSAIRLFNSSRNKSSSNGTSTSLPNQLDRCMAFASLTPLIPSLPGANNGVPSTIAEAKSSNTAMCCPPQTLSNSITSSVKISPVTAAHENTHNILHTHGFAHFIFSFIQTLDGNFLTIINNDFSFIAIRFLNGLSPLHREYVVTNTPVAPFP